MEGQERRERHWAYRCRALWPISSAFQLPPAFQHLHIVILLRDHGLLLAKVHRHAWLLHRWGGRGHGRTTAGRKHFLAHLFACDVHGRFVYHAQGVVPSGLVHECWQDLCDVCVWFNFNLFLGGGEGERTGLWALGVVHENELWMTAFCETVPPAAPPCVGVL